MIYLRGVLLLKLQENACLYQWVFVTSIARSLAIPSDGWRNCHPTIVTCCHTKTWRGDHDLCLSRSSYTDTHRTSKERGHHVLCLSRSSYTDTHRTSKERGHHVLCLSRSNYTDTETDSGRMRGRGSSVGRVRDS